MKKLLILFIFIIPMLAEAQSPLGRHDVFGISAGYKHLNIERGNFDVAFLEFDLYVYSTQFEYTAKIEYGKDYLSYEPLGALGVILMAFMFNGAGKDMSTTTGERFLIILLGTSSAKIPIYIADGRIELCPQWNMLKITRLYNDDFQLNASVGASLKVYLNKSLYLSPMWEYSFGYKKESPFTGHAYGMSLGFYF